MGKMHKLFIIRAARLTLLLIINKARSPHDIAIGIINRSFNNCFSTVLLTEPEQMTRVVPMERAIQFSINLLTI